MQSKERNHNSSPSHALVGIIIFFISCPLTISKALKQNDGFSTELIHVNSPSSPFFNYTKHNRSSSLIEDEGHYLMEISYGNPMVKYYHIVDTASETSWIQCLPCVHCYKSKYAPFNPNNSKTFRLEKSPKNETIIYYIEYEDHSHTQGAFARETIRVGSGLHKIKFKEFLFGCGHDNVGIFPYKSSGLVGFNVKMKSFIFQLREVHQGKFSYCMAPPKSSRPGKISFGNIAIVSGNNVMTTPLTIDSDYYIMLNAITVGTHKLNYFPDSHVKSNNSDKVNGQLKLIIDTGTNALYLSRSFYIRVEEKVKKYIRKTPVSTETGYTLCYSSSLKDAEIPKIKLHFPGATLVLSAVNTFVQDHRHRCLAILPCNDSFILGSMAQINFLVGYNLEKKKISFKPTNCARL